tara:strand:- start:2812 stop:3114 length:303 start_codon:yes stop_codon:yes gene_type:complete
MKIVKTHNSSKEDLKHGIDSLREKIEQRFGDDISNAKYAWSDDELSFCFGAKGFQIDGIMTVSDSCASVDLKLPLPLKIFQEQIRSAISNELENIINTVH